MYNETPRYQCLTIYFSKIIEYFDHVTWFSTSKPHKLEHEITELN